MTAMISDKKQVQQLAAVLLAGGVKEVVLSPGSRNGPLIHTFAGSGKFRCYSVVDERSAAYFALGLALAREKPVALACTSGTAALGYAPGVAEAFYRNAPLIVITADRPQRMIDQAESQCIRQENIYRDFTKKEVTLPSGDSADELWFAERLVNECINVAVAGNPGPVHLNLPLEEPLHGLTAQELPPVKTIRMPRLHTAIGAPLPAAFGEAKRVMILAGQQSPDPRTENLLVKLAAQNGVAVLTEHLSNLRHPLFAGCIDLLMAFIKKKPEKFRPNLLISFGGQFVSKSLKQFLRNNKPDEHWHICPQGSHFDICRALTRVVSQAPEDFLEALSEQPGAADPDWLPQWKNAQQAVESHRNAFAGRLEFCDMMAVRQILNAIPEGSAIHLGNSSPVRYALLEDPVAGALYLSNRGTAGIDGCLSTAAGFAAASPLLHTVILGDLSFFYDSNGLWNRYVGDNLRIVVLNNSGGNIFGMIKGPDASPAFDDYIFARHHLRAKGIAETFGLDYYSAAGPEELEQALASFYGPARKGPALLEVFTDAETNSRTFRELFESLPESH